MRMLRRRLRTILLPLLALGGLTSGCQQPAGKPTMQPAVPAPAADRIYVFPGIGCGEWCLLGATKAFRDAGVTAELRIVDWETPFFAAMQHLQDYAANREHADDIAREMRLYRLQHPEATIDIVGYSGGGGVAVMVAEMLGAEVRPRNVVLVQAAISPRYDLTAALKRIDGQLVNLYCPSDWFILGLGTQTFGTIDRANTASAGKDGFQVSAAVPDESLRAKLVQRGWDAEMIRTGHIGNHGGILLYAWNKQYVAPWLLPAAGAADTGVDG